MKQLITIKPQWIKKYFTDEEETLPPAEIEPAYSLPVRRAAIHHTKPLNTIDELLVYYRMLLHYTTKKIKKP